MFLRAVSNEDYRFLYGLLEERPPEANISHRKMPSWEEHIEFCNSRPYQMWFIIIDNDDETRLGSVYKTKLGEIGIFVKKEFQGKGVAQYAVKSICGLSMTRNLANIAPGNERSKRLFEGLGFKKIQETYELL